ncbi:MAG: tRNA (adenosine(37)-N6)-threonylcarbamoyltransferase complex dimerization subunit type 1 TsaB, partial [Actinomycetota bacterium]
MISLVIDTSTNRTSVALFENNQLLFSGFHDGATAHAEVLPKLVKEALHTRQDINQVIVGMGPGPFTGLRVGITFAQAFAHARNITWRGACSLDAMDVDSESYIVTSDARRKELYWAKYENGLRVKGPFVSAPGEVTARNENKFGFGFTEPIYPSMAMLLAKSQTAPINEPLYLRRPDAVP